MPDVDAALTDVRAILAERPGRVSAGLAATWGKDFKVGAVPFYALLTRAHLDQASFLYHSMSRTADVMVLRDESSAVHDVVFGVRAVVAPIDRPAAPGWRLRGMHGRFAVYEASPEGYVGLVDEGARYTGPSEGGDDVNEAWLGSALPGQGIVAVLAGGDAALPAFGRWQPLPSPAPGLLLPRGAILAEGKHGEEVTARVSLLRPCHVLVKVTWDPDLAATVDGRPARLEPVTPGFGAVAVGAGVHEVHVAYSPGPLRPLLLVLGVALFAGCGVPLRPSRVARWEDAAAARLASLASRLDTPRRRAALAVAVLVLLAGRPLLRGRLIDGHDAAEYPPRLVEFARVVGDGQLPPVWAPDLGSGYGQPLFEFAPPLLYVAALPLHAAGAGLADAVQLALLLLLAGGGAAAYRLARRWDADRSVAVAATALWLLAPYVSLDLFVRAAFAEAAALAVAPVALLGVLRVVDRPTVRRVAVAGVAVALVVLGHNAVALLLLPALAVVAAASSLTPRPDMRRLLAGAATLAAGLGLSAFFWLPALVEKRFVKVELLRQGFLSWREHLVHPLQLLWSRWGYGLSGPGADGMSFAVGALHLLLAGVGVALVLRRGGPRRRAELLALAAVALSGAWLATSWAAPVWRHVATLQYLAYPWRCLFLPALLLPLLAVPALARLPRAGLVLVATAVLVLNLPHTEPRGYLTFDDAYYAPASIAARGLNTTTREEYEPRWVGARPPAAEAPLAGLTAPVEIVRSNLSSARRTFTVRADAATAVEAATFYYPGWVVTVDGAPARLSVVPLRGTIAFRLPAGEHRVELRFGATPLRRAAGWVSLGAAVLMIAVGLLPRRWRRAERRAG